MSGYRNRSDYMQWLQRLRLPLPSLAQHRACIFLERHGFRFLVDFGTENAVAKAREFRCMR
ncbi:MAG: hypothetical protein RLY20_2485 [Verrucomicrobiota bacterium]|jgi:hypothetical protein